MDVTSRVQIQTNVRTGCVGKEACIQDSCQSVMNVCVVVRCDSNLIWISNFRYCFGGLLHKL